MKRNFLCIFAVLAAIAVLNSCNNVTENANNNISDYITNETEGVNDLLSDLPKADYDGYTFRILTRNGQIYDQYSEEDSEDIVRSAIYKRNKMVEELYNVEIVGFETSTGNYETEALNGILAGDDAYDLIFPHSRAAFTYALNGAAYNINNIEAINLDKPYWSSDLRNSFEVNGKMYFLDGDITTHRLSHAMCLNFNKRIFDELGFDYPYELVKNGEWTFDEFAYLAKKGGKDLNGDGVMNPADDQYGFFDSDWFGPIQIIYTGGEKIYNKNDEGEIELTLYSNKTIDIFSEYFGLMENKNCFLRISDVSPYTGNLFQEGRAMMAYSSLGLAEGYRAMEDDFGILPWPKFDEEDEYAAIVNAYAHIGFIPVTVSDVDRTGTIAEALCAYGSEYVVPAFYEVSLKTKNTRDDESEEMIDIVKDSIVYDIGYVSRGPFESAGHEIAKRGSGEFSSFYSGMEGSAKIHLREINESFGEK